MKPIQMVDLKGQYQKIKQEIDTAIFQVIDSSIFVKGGKVIDFQKKLEDYLHVKHVIPVGNGTDALQISLMALGLNAGDEVIVPTFTFIATAEVVSFLGLNLVLVDVNTDFCLNMDAVKQAITPRTKAIIPVHLFGQNANMEELLKIAREHHLFVIEDACQSMGSTYTFDNGDTVFSGCMGNSGCTSFFPSKNLGCFGDGGAIVTNDDDLAERMRSIANHGMTTKRYYSDRIGVNSRLDSMQAAILEVKLRHLDDYNRARKKVAEQYDSAFQDCPEIVVPQRNPKSSHVFHQYTIILQGVSRDKLQAWLKEKGVPSMTYFPVPVHLQKAYKHAHYQKGDFPVAEMLSENVLSLPMHTELEDEQLDYIVKTVKQGIHSLKK